MKFKCPDCGCEKYDSFWYGGRFDTIECKECGLKWSCGNDSEFNLDEYYKWVKEQLIGVYDE